MTTAAQETKEIVALVKNPGWSRELTLSIIETSEIKEFKRGDILCEAGKFENYPGLLLYGELFVLSKHGASKARICPVDIFGEIFFILPNPRSAFVIAARNSAYLQITFAPFTKLLSKNPHIAAERYQWLSSRLAECITEETQDIHPSIALIAHNSRKQELIEFARQHGEILQGFDLTATGSTAKRLLDEADVSVTRTVASGPPGEDQAFGQFITTGNIRAVIFFHDPLHAHPHEADVQELIQLCNVYNIPLATNAGSAEFLLQRLASDNWK